MSQEKLARLVGQFHGLRSRAQSLLKPHLHFGAPRQLAPEAGVSWWHIPVFIEPTPIQQRVLHGCRVYLVATDVDGQRLHMRWRSLASPLTADELTLVDGELYLVPVAARKETAKNRGVIVTTARFLADQKAKLVAPVGRSAWRLEIVSEQKRWESPHSYRLNVPPPNRGNGDFTLEVAYDRFD